MDAGKIKEIFGYTDRESHRARLLVSDAYCDSITESKMIPAGTVLKMWMIFDNMTADEVNLIEELRKNNKNVVTGRTSAKWDASTKSTKFNAVMMEFERVEIFKTSSYLAGI